MLDLIDECGQDLSVCGYESVKLNRFDITCNKLFVDTTSKAKELGFGKGHYFIINAPLLSGLLEEHREILSNEISYRFKFLMKENGIKKKDRFLFVGIGNPKLSADSFGAKVIEKIEICPFKKNNRFFKIVPNIFLNTGINAFDIIKLIVDAFNISAVILFDALATNNFERLGCSIQFNDAGLTPGSAMNSFGKPINKDSLKVPCLSFGVPMLISSLNLGEKKEVILTEKDSEEKIKFLSTLIAGLINENLIK